MGPFVAHSGLFNGQGTGPNYYGYFEDFLGGPAFPTTTPAAVTPTPWTRTLVNASVSVYQASGSGVGGVLLATNDTAQNDAQQYQWSQEIMRAFGPSSTQTPAQGGLDMHLEIRCAFGDITNMDFFLGFAKIGTTQIATPPTDRIGILKSNKASFDLSCLKGSSNYSGADGTSFLTIPDTNFHTYYMRVVPYDDLTTGSVHIWIDGKLSGMWTKRLGNAPTLPTVSLSPVFGQLSHAAGMTGAALAVQYDYVAFSQRRFK